MTIFWNDFEILQLIDACHEGERGGINSGIDLAQMLAADREVPLSNEDYASLVRELFVLQSAGLLTWQGPWSGGRARPITPAEPNDYLNNIRDFALTIEGRDRARGQIVRVPMPDPTEDDGHMIASLTLEDVARIIGFVYAPEQAARLIVEAGMSPGFDPGEGETWEKLLLVFVTFLHGSSGQRRELRQFLGAWLDDELHTGPSDEEREKILGDLARQGWFVKDGRLVSGEPVRRGRGTQEPTPDVDQLHPIVWKAAESRWNTNQRHDAVLAASKAVNAMLKELLGRNDINEVALVQEAFSKSPPDTGKLRLRFLAILDKQTCDSMTAGALSFGVGCFMAIRNPIGHLPDDDHEMTEQEASEQLAAWSLFARWIDQTTVVHPTD